MTTRPTTEIDRARDGYWNSNPVSTGNPGGMDESDDGTVGGHIDNFPAAVRAVGLMTQWTGEQADLAGQAGSAAADARAAAQAAAAVAASAAGGTVWCGLAAGTANALTVAPAVALEALYDGLTARFVAVEANTAAATLKVGALPVKPLCGPLGTALTPGALSPDLISTVTYIATADHWRQSGGAGGASLAKIHAYAFGI